MLSGLRPGLTTRLVLAFGLVVAVGGSTAWLVVGAIGPAAFDAHLARAGLSPTSEVVTHARKAFAAASGSSLTIALLASFVASLGVSVFVARRIGLSLTRLSQAAARVAKGERMEPLPSTGAGREFDALARDFTTMANQLAAAEELRRRLISDVAHELRTPVATLSGYLEGIEDGVRVADPSTVAVLRSATARLARLAEDLTDVTSAEAGPRSLRVTKVNIWVVIEAARAAAAPAFAEKGVELIARAENDLWIDADPERLGQVLGNLLNNAVRHTSPGGRVAMTARSARIDAVIDVADDGDGIEPIHLSHVFDRFYRCDNARDRDHGGSGIGLAIVRGLVAAHGGTVEAQSEGLGAGALFRVVLPLRVGSSTGANS